ncbi:hypothetical protein SEA_BIGGITYBASS_29 [Gordonia phage BiggityBass]|nr:hypothetical protein SEA_BIGGITYBASS_29 [Gordonia phage BiggityBass]
MVNVCVSENLQVEAGAISLAPWSVPRLVVDVVGSSSGDGPLFPQVTLPGKLLIDVKAGWVNDAPVDQMVLLRITRGRRDWLVSNPNAIQVRDRWSYALDREPAVPTTVGSYNSQVGSAIDLGTNTVAEPLDGRQWVSQDAHSSDEWVGPVAPGQKLNVWYRCYVWTPPPFSDNANGSNPQHEVRARYTRVQMIAYPQQGSLVAG